MDHRAWPPHSWWCDRMQVMLTSVSVTVVTPFSLILEIFLGVKFSLPSYTVKEKITQHNQASFRKSVKNIWVSPAPIAESNSPSPSSRLSPSSLVLMCLLTRKLEGSWFESHVQHAWSLSVSWPLTWSCFWVCVTSSTLVKTPNFWID